MTDQSNINGYLAGNFSQYLNALDFKKRNLDKGRHYLFILCTHPKVYREIKKNLVPADWDKVWIFYNPLLILLVKMQIPVLSGYAYLLNEYYVYKKALRVSGKFRFNYFAVGNYFYPTYRSLSNQVTKNKVIVLDDGANIIHGAEYIKTDNPNNYLTSSRFGLLLFRNLSVKYHPSIIYFGTYRKVKFREGDQVILNDRFGEPLKFNLTDSTYIIGQKLYGTLMSLERYTAILKEVVREFNSGKVYYIPHRMEPEEAIDEIKKSFMILRPGEPIENYIMNQKTSPEKFISFYSTALLNLKLMNIPEASFYAIKCRELFNAAKGKIREEAFEYYQSEGINIITK